MESGRIGLTVYGVAWLGPHLVQRNRETTEQLRARVNIDAPPISHRETTEQLRARVNIDAGLFNYGYFASQLDTELERVRRYGHPVSLLMVDLDDLKAYNDEHGHLMGSQALKEIATILKDGSRAVDIPAKYGGDEFALILHETAKAGAAILAERFCARVREYLFLLGGTQRTGRLSVSIGVSAFPEDADTNRDLVEKADLALYDVKRSGKDRAKVFGEEGFRGVVPPRPA